MNGMITKARRCLAAAAISAMALMLTQSTALAADNASQPIQQVGSGLCLDTLNSDSVHKSVSTGEAIYLNPCDHSAQQEWIAKIIPGGVAAMALQAPESATDECLDLTNGSTIPGQRLQFWDCNTSNPNQQWVRQVDGTIKNMTIGLCLDSKDSGTGAPLLVTATCNGSDSQRFQFLDRGTDAEPINLDEPSGPIHGTGGYCLDVEGGFPDGTATNGQKITLFATCTGAANQNWTIMSDNTIRSGGKCLDIPGGTGWWFGSGLNDPVQVYECNGTSAQVWLPREDGSIYNPDSRYCLGYISESEDSTVVRLGLKNCQATPDQQFDFPAHEFVPQWG